MPTNQKAPVVEIQQLVDDRLYNEVEAAELLTLSHRTMRFWRSKKLGPPYSLLGTRVVYSHADLMSWVRERKVQQGATA